MLAHSVHQEDIRVQSAQKIRAARLHSAEKVLQRTISGSKGVFDGGSPGGNVRRASEIEMNDKVAVETACSSINVRMIDVYIEEVVNESYRFVIYSRIVIYQLTLE